MLHSSRNILFSAPSSYLFICLSYPSFLVAPSINLSLLFLLTISFIISFATSLPGSLIVAFLIRHFFIHPLPHSRKLIFLPSSPSHLVTLSHFLILFSYPACFPLSLPYCLNLIVHLPVSYLFTYFTHHPSGASRRRSIGRLHRS